MRGDRGEAGGEDCPVRTELTTPDLHQRPSYHEIPKPWTKGNTLHAARGTGSAGVTHVQEAKWHQTSKETALATGRGWRRAFKELDA